MKKLLAIPPGATITEHLAFTGMSPEEFAARMGMDKNATDSLIHGEADVTFDLAAKLERVLGIPAHFWMNLESAYRAKLAQIAAVA